MKRKKKKKERKEIKGEREERKIEKIYIYTLLLTPSNILFLNSLIT